MLKRLLQVLERELVILMACLSVCSSQQLANEEKWKELTQYFGINDRFESPAHSRPPQKVTVDTIATSAFIWQCKNSALAEFGIKLRLFGSE